MKSEHFSSLSPRSDLPSLLASMDGRSAPDGAQTARSWYQITNLSPSEAEITLYDEIGMWGVTASDFIRDLKSVKATSIALRINSPGGEVFDAIAISNALRRHPATITTYVDGIAASAASFIAMAGDSVVMSPHAQIMIHDAAGLVLGNAADMRQMADMLDRTSNTIASMYAEKAGGTVEEWRAAMVAESWYSDQEAVDAGLADRIDGVEITDRLPRAVAEPAPEPEPEPIAEPEEQPIEEPVPTDYMKQFEELAADAARADLIAYGFITEEA